MESVARRSDVSKLVVYKWFANRDALLLALIERENRRLDERVERALIAATTFEDKARAISAAYLDVVDSTEPSIADVLARTVASPEFHARQTQRNFEVLATIAAMVFDHFDVTEAQSLTAAVMMAKSLEGIIELWRGTSASREQMTEDFVAFCLAGLQAMVVRHRGSRDATESYSQTPAAADEFSREDRGPNVPCQCTAQAATS